MVFADRRSNRVDELHAMRIAAKRLRYTMEIFPAAFDSPAQSREFNALFEKIKSIQEQIGEIHDSDVRAPLLQEFLDQHGEARPEIRIGLQRLIDEQHAVRAKHYRSFLTFWNKLQKQGFRRRFLQLLAMDPPESDKENTPLNEKDSPQHERQDRQRTVAA